MRPKCSLRHIMSRFLDLSPICLDDKSIVFRHAFERFEENEYQCLGQLDLEGVCNCETGVLLVCPEGNTFLP
jgi:hypothetical protein